MQKLISAGFLIFMLAACSGGQSGKGTVTVAAAANLAAPMRELKAVFAAAHPGINLKVSFGASGVLATQIRQGAPFSVFLSADAALPRQLREDGWAVTEPRVYARGQLILFSAKSRDFTPGLHLLATPSVAVIVIANPETAPYGMAAREVLMHTGLWDEVASKLARAQTVAQVTQQVLGAADVGFIARSSLFLPEMSAYNREGVYWIDLDPSLYSPLDQAAVICRQGEGDAAVQSFYDFIFSAPSAAVFVKFGYERGPE